MALPVTLTDIIFLHPQPPPFKVGSSFYIVAQDASTTTAIKVLKADSDDPTGTWSEQDAANRPAISTIVTALHAVVDGTTIHIVTIDGSNHVDYHTFNTSTNAWGIVDEQIVTGATSPPDFLWAGVRSDGDVLLAYTGARDSIMGTLYDRAYIARRESGTWTADIRVDGLDKVEKDITLGAAIMADQTNDRFHVIYAVTTDSALFVSTYRSDNSFHASGQDISIDATIYVADAAFRDNMDIVSFDDGGTQKIRGFYRDSDNDLNSYGFDDSDTPGSFTLTADINDAGDIDSSALAVDGTTQHALFRDSTDTSNIRHDQTGAGNDTWGTDTDEIDAASGDKVVWASAVYDQGGTVLAYIYADGGSLKYNERSLGAADTGLDAANLYRAQMPVFLKPEIVGY